MPTKSASSSRATGVRTGPSTSTTGNVRARAGVGAGAGASTGTGSVEKQATTGVSTSSSSSASRFAFRFRTALAVFSVFNLVAALLAPIQDCDETYNYWEPVHYLLHRYGRQTWEYSPEYAIRDWLYIALHSSVAGLGGLVLRQVTAVLPLPLRSVLAVNVHELFLGGKLAEFYALRAGLAVLAAACQARFASAIARTLNPRVAGFTGLIMISSPGFFNAVPALLPSSFAMNMGMLGASAFMDWKMGAGGGAMSHGSNAGIMWFGIGAVLGWPFAGALIAPFLLEELVVAIIAEDKVELLRRWLDGGLRLAIVIALQLAVNLFFYHKVVVVPLNIVLYNVFSGPGRGPDIFGTEPVHFYFLNLAINFNIWLLLGLLAGPLLLVQWLASGRGQSKYMLMRSLFFVTPFYLWLAIFSAQAHKEERFMYPAYPFLALNAAITLHGLLGFIGTADRTTLMGKIPPQLKFLVVSIAVLAAIDLGAARVAATVSGYRSPMRVYGALHTAYGGGRGATADDEVCFGKEWYRFPASFFLPNGAHAKFIRSEFNGLLPGEFSEAGTGFGIYPGTWLEPTGMNDLNQFDPGKLTDIRRCTYLVDSHRSNDGSISVVDDVDSGSGSALEPVYAAMTDEWEPVQCARFLDAARTPTLARLLWVPDQLAPLLPAQFHRRWKQFCLLKRRSAH